jgi:hypothetical protein
VGDAQAASTNVVAAMSETIVELGRNLDKKKLLQSHLRGHHDNPPGWWAIIEPCCHGFSPSMVPTDSARLFFRSQDDPEESTTINGALPHLLFEGRTNGASTHPNESGDHSFTQTTDPSSLEAS